MSKMRSQTRIVTVIHTKLSAGKTRNRGLKDYSGVRFGRLVAMEFIEREPVYNNHKWRFLCDCGTSKALRIKDVRSGHTSSCGCLFTETIATRNTTHGLSRPHPAEYKVWKDMRSRCRNPNRRDYLDYGGRGISVCQRWDDFAAFFEDIGPRPDGMTLDRRDVDGNYEPSNCQWATATEQANNRRSNRYVCINGHTRTLHQWCEYHGVGFSTASWRLRQGWSVDDIFSNTDRRQCPR